MTNSQTALVSDDEAVTAGGHERSRWLSTLRHPMVWVLIGLLAMTTYLYPGFWTIINLQNMLMQNVALTLASIGMTFVILAGGFDLSVGAIYASGAVLYVSMDGSRPVWFAVLSSLILGGVCGLINGLLVNWLRINPFVATLGTSSAFIGLMTLYAGANTKYSLSDEFGFLGTYKWNNLIPLSVAVTTVVFAASAVALSRTTYGRSLYAVGGNKEAARLAGIRVGVIFIESLKVVSYFA